MDDRAHVVMAATAASGGQEVSSEEEDGYSPSVPVYPVSDPQLLVDPQVNPPVDQVKTRNFGAQGGCGQGKLLQHCYTFESCEENKSVGTCILLAVDQCGGCV